MTMRARWLKMLTDMPNKYCILDPDGDDDRDEMIYTGKSAIEEEHRPGDDDRDEMIDTGTSAIEEEHWRGDDDSDEMIDTGTSAIEEEHRPGDWKNPNDRGEESVTVGSSKSSVDQYVISPEKEESATEAEEESGKRSEMVGMRSQLGLVGVKIGGTFYPVIPLEISSRPIEEAATERALLASHDKLAKKEKKKQKKKAKAEAKAQKKAKAEAKAKANDEENGKAVASVTDAGRPEESVSEAEQAVKKEAKDGALLVGLNSTGGESPMRKQAEEEPVPDYYSKMPPKNREKLMKHNARMAAAMKILLFGHEKLPESSKRRENSEGKRLSEMMRISPETQLYAEVRRALLDIEEKLTKKKSRKMDKETLRLLKDMSNMLDQGGDDDEKDEIDDSDDTNEGANTTMVESHNEPADPSATNSMTKLGQYSVQDDLDHDRGKSATRLAKKTVTEEMADEAESYASYCRLWEYKWSKTCGFFDEITVLSSMQFTHYTPGPMPFSSDCYAAETLQIISIKLTGLAGGLGLPLSVYGVVAVRDMVDHNRNILFSRDRSEAQELKQNDPFLHLIGPSRAIVFTDKVWIEIELRVKGGAYSQDKALISCARRYRGGNGPGVSTICFKNVLCTLELCFQPVKRTVQATILGVQVARNIGSWPLKHGGLVACSPLEGKFVFSDSGFTRRINPSSSQIVLIEAKDEAMPKGQSGYVDLWRQVVSVELEGRLDVVIKAYSESGAIAAETRVPFYPKVCNISEKKCALGDSEVTITVAWSLVAASKTGLSIELSSRRFV